MDDAGAGIDDFDFVEFLELIGPGERSLPAMRSKENFTSSAGDRAETIVPTGRRAA